jgi:hypothetical protein
LLAELLGRLFALDLAHSLLPASDKESQTQGRKVGHKNGEEMLVQLVYQSASRTPRQGSLLQVYFSSSAFSQKVSRKQLRGSFINVFCLSLSAQALLLRSFTSSRDRDGEEMAQALRRVTFGFLLPDASRDERWKPEGSHIQDRSEAPKGE